MRNGPVTQLGPWLTPPQIARQLGVDAAKVIRWIGSGELVGVNVATSTGGRPRWRVAPEELEAFLGRRRATPATRAPRRRRAAFERKYYR